MIYNKTPKSWKSTAECKERVGDMKVGGYYLNIRILREDGITFNPWYWRITAYHPEITVTGNSRHNNEDQAANEAYKFAHKHLRPKRRKKKT